MLTDWQSEYKPAKTIHLIFNQRQFKQCIPFNQEAIIYSSFFIIGYIVNCNETLDKCGWIYRMSGTNPFPSSHPVILSPLIKEHRFQRELGVIPETLVHNLVAALLAGWNEHTRTLG